MVVVKTVKMVIVERNETLSHIALKCLGDANRWLEIFDANYAIICATQRRYKARQVGSPHLIYPGMALVVSDVDLLPPLDAPQWWLDEHGLN